MAIRKVYEERLEKAFNNLDWKPLKNEAEVCALINGARVVGADVTGSPGIEGLITYYKTAEGKLIALDCSCISSLDLEEDEEPFFVQFAIIPENKED